MVGLKEEKKYMLGAFVVFLYLFVSFVLLFLSAELLGSVSVVVSFYAWLGFDLGYGVAQNLMVFWVSSCFVHLVAVFFVGVDEGWPGFKGHDLGTMLYCFLRFVLVFCFCVISLGALGDNISARNISAFSKVVSELVGAFVLGGWVWVASDFVGSIYVNSTRRV